MVKVIKRILLWTITLAIMITLHSTIIPYLSISGVYPNVVLASLMVLSIWHGRVIAIWTAFFVGLLLDMWSPTNLGMQALSLSLSVFFVGLFEARKINLGPIILFFIFIVGALIDNSVIYALAVNKGNLMGFLLSDALPRSVFTSLVAMVFVFGGNELFNPRGRL